MFQYRDYQKNAETTAVKLLNNGKKERKLIVIPTAGGKSHVIAGTVKNYNSTVVVLQPNKELLLQNYTKFLAAGGTASICCASLKEKTIKGKSYTRVNGKLIENEKISNVTYATPGTIKKYKQLLKKRKLNALLIDECHLGVKEDSTIRDFIDFVGIDNVIGFTATPVVMKNSLSGAYLQMLNRLKSKLFKDIEHVTQIKHLVDNNWWAPIDYDVKDTSREFLKTNSNGSDFTLWSQKKFYKENDLYKRILNYVKVCKEQGRKRILVFVPSIDEADTLHKKIPNSGVVHSKMDGFVRRKTLEKFEKGEISVVINVSVLTVGYDNPKLDTIIMARPTSSITIYYQIIGRGVRIDPEGEKQDCKIIDLSGNYNTFGPVETLTFENFNNMGWDMFGKQGVLLTRYPIRNEVRPSKKTIVEKKSKDEIESHMFTFGKYKGRSVAEVAKTKEGQGYLNWMLRDFSFGSPKMKMMKKNIVTALENG